MVDIAREERIQKADQFIDELKKFRETDTCKGMMEDDIDWKLMITAFY